MKRYKKNGLIAVILPYTFDSSIIQLQKALILLVPQIGMHIQRQHLFSHNKTTSFVFQDNHVKHCQFVKQNVKHFTNKKQKAIGNVIMERCNRD